VLLVSASSIEKVIKKETIFFPVSSICIRMSFILMLLYSRKLSTYALLTCGFFMQYSVHGLLRSTIIYWKSMAWCDNNFAWKLMFHWHKIIIENRYGIFCITSRLYFSWIKYFIWITLTLFLRTIKSTILDVSVVAAPLYCPTKKSRVSSFLFLSAFW